MELCCRSLVELDVDAYCSFVYALVVIFPDLLYPAFNALTQAVALLIRPQCFKHTHSFKYFKLTQKHCWVLICEPHARIVKEVRACVRACVCACVHVIGVGVPCGLWLSTAHCSKIQYTFLFPSHKASHAQRQNLTETRRKSLCNLDTHTPWNAELGTHYWVHGPVKDQKHGLAFV